MLNKETMTGPASLLERAVPAWRIRLALRAFAVVELAAGALEHSQTGDGDPISLVQP